MAEPSWDLYRTFLGVLAHGSLSAAARELGLTQPTVGRHVDALEQALGAQLFTRSQSGLEVTRALKAGSSRWPVALERSHRSRYWPLRKRGPCCASPKSA